MPTTVGPFERASSPSRNEPESRLGVNGRRWPSEMECYPTGSQRLELRREEADRLAHHRFNIDFLQFFKSETKKLIKK